MGHGGLDVGVVAVSGVMDVGAVVPMIVIVSGVGGRTRTGWWPFSKETGPLMAEEEGWAWLLVNEGRRDDFWRCVNQTDVVWP